MPSITTEKWHRLGEWQTILAALIRIYEDSLNMSVTHINCSYSPVQEGDLDIEYQGRKKRKTTNLLYFRGRQGLPLAAPNPQRIKYLNFDKINIQGEEIKVELKNCGLCTYCLSSNVNAGFDAN